MKIILQLDDKITTVCYPDSVAIHFDAVPHGWMRVVPAGAMPLSSFFRLDCVLGIVPDDVPIGSEAKVGALDRTSWTYDPAEATHSLPKYDGAPL